MNRQLFIVACAVGSVASIGNLPAQDNQNRNTAQPTLEYRTDQLERGQQDLKTQIEQLRNDVSDLQDRVYRLEGGPGPAQGAPPPAAKSSETRGRPDEQQNGGSAESQSFDVFYQGLQSVATGLMTRAMDMSGSRMWLFPTGIGARTATAIGPTRIGVGPGSPMKTSAGQLTTMVGGPGEQIVDGSGFRVASGHQPGSPGDKATITWA